MIVRLGVVLKCPNLDETDDRINYDCSTVSQFSIEEILLSYKSWFGQSEEQRAGVKTDFQ